MKRRYLLIGLILVLTIAGSFNRRPPLGSTFVPGNHGSQAFLTLLEKIGVAPKRHLSPFDNLPNDKTGYTLFLISPDEAAGESALANWISKGNRLVLFDNPQVDSRKLLEKIGIIRPPILSAEFEIPKLEDDSVKVTLPEQPSHGLLQALDGIDRISTPRGFAAIPTEQQESIISDEKLSYAIYFTRDKGDVWYFAGPEMTLNRSIDLYDNLRFLVQLIRAPGLVLFDEFHHGFREPLAAEMRQRWDLLVLLLSGIGVVILLGFLSRAVRFGPPVKSLTSAIASTTQFITALGLLYSAHRAVPALSSYVLAWKKRIGRRFSINPELNPEQLSTALLSLGILSLPESERLRSILKLFDSNNEAHPKPKELDDQIEFLEMIATKQVANS